MITGPFRVITHRTIVEVISRARDYVCLLAPGVDDEIANTLARAAKRLGSEHVVVILDPNEWVERAGYGKIAALDALVQSGVVVRSGRGVRLCVLNTESACCLFSPTPLSVEPEHEEDGPPNGVVLEGDAARGILESLAPQLAGQHDRGPQIGRRPIRADEITAAQAELESRPPVRPDLARQISVINSKVMIVRIELRGLRPERQTMRLNHRMLGITKSEFQRRFRAQWQVVDGSDVDGLFKVLNHKLDTIKKRFIRPVGGVYGNLIRRDRQHEFEAAFGRLKSEVEEFRKFPPAGFIAVLKRNREELVRFVHESLLRNPPDDLPVKEMDEGEQSRTLFKLAESEVDRAGFPKPEEYMQRISCKYAVTNVSESLLCDPAFREAVERLMGTSIDELVRLERAVAAD